MGRNREQILRSLYRKIDHCSLNNVLGKRMPIVPSDDEVVFLNELILEYARKSQ